MKLLEQMSQEEVSELIYVPPLISDLENVEPEERPYTLTNKEFQRYRKEVVSTPLP